MSVVPNFHCEDTGQGFIRYNNQKTTELISNKDNINELFAKKYSIKKEDIFPFVYALLNSPDYQKYYANDLKKDLARIPNVIPKNKYIEIGKKLMDIHLNYEKMPVYNKVVITNTGKYNYKVTKMKFDKKYKDKSVIIFNDDIIISNIPEKAYQYIVNGKSAIEWIMDQYRIKTDKKSGIIDNPNDYSNDPKYIFNLLLKIINVSVQTVDLINQIPPLAIEN